MPDSAGALTSVTGNVVMRNSPRSFVSPRKAIAAIGAVELKVKLPLNGGKLLNGDCVNGNWYRKAAICPPGGMVVLPLPKSPFEFVKKKETTAGSAFGFAIANPVSTTPLTSAKIRPA